MIIVLKIVQQIKSDRAFWQVWRRMCAIFISFPSFPLRLSSLLPLRAADPLVLSSLLLLSSVFPLWPSFLLLLSPVFVLLSLSSLLLLISCSRRVPWVILESQRRRARPLATLATLILLFVM